MLTTVDDQRITKLTLIIYTISSPRQSPFNVRRYLSIEKSSAAAGWWPYMGRRPRIANRFEVRTMNGSVVTAKIAGILS
ncbi:hypothetical protein ACVGW2_11810, partial [Enterobacter intestinihominis]